MDIRSKLEGAVSSVEGAAVNKNIAPKVQEALKNVKAAGDYAAQRTFAPPVTGPLSSDEIQPDTDFEQTKNRFSNLQYKGDDGQLHKLSDINSAAAFSMADYMLYSDLAAKNEVQTRKSKQQKELEALDYISEQLNGGNNGTE